MSTQASQPNQTGKVWYALSFEQFTTAMASDFERGLTDEQASQQRAEYGPNELAEAPAVPWWKRLLAQFQELVIWILIVAALISAFMGEVIDTIAILAIVILNGVIGFLQEERAERALTALQKLSAPTAKVIRGGKPRSFPATELVPGDLIELEAGDNVPADARLITSFGLTVQEAALTGESVPVEKDAKVALPQPTPLGDRRNMVFMGTVVTAGKSRAIVVATGMNTELGHIAGLLQRQEREPTPLQRRLAELGRVLIVICLAIVTLVFVLQMLRGEEWSEVFLLSVSLAVAAVPEGLPAVVTIALALGLQRMVKRNALIRKLASVETLGSVTVICTDKTGTLTRNEMTVLELVVTTARYRVTGVGYTPRGEFIPASLVAPVSANLHDARAASQSGPAPESKRIDPSTSPDLVQALTIAAWCNNARLVPDEADGTKWRVSGDPTEGALCVVALKGGVEAMDRANRVLHEIPFDSTRKAMSVVVRQSAGQVVMYTKGAPEVILEKCTTERRDGRTVPLSDHRRRAWLQWNSEMASRALRVLALAYREMPENSQVEYEEKDLILAGLVGMMDPPREEAKVAVHTCREAGIRPVMITGDHPQTGLAIARELVIATTEESVLPGTDLDQMSDEDLTARVDQIAVYARATAEHKLRVVKAWKRRGEVVAMTGDGVNDAPAVRTADIGIAMGITGTDVTKEASDMVLMDDNFASIVNAVEEGRGIYDNIQKVLQFLLSCNAGEVLAMLLASLFHWPPPLQPIQLLWINLVTDGLPALALSVEPPEPGIMQRRPRATQESILSWRVGALLLFQGFLIAAVTLIAFAGHLQLKNDLARAQSMAFCVMVYAQLFWALAARSKKYTLGQLGFFTNPKLLFAVVASGLLQLVITLVPFLRTPFGLARHDLVEWAAILLLSLVPVTMVEVNKLVRRYVAAKEPNATNSSAWL